MRGLRTAKTKHAVCTHCGGANEVARRAMSVFCAHCRKRLILEDYTIKTYQGVKGYSTCGDIVVEKSGRVTAPIQAHTVTVKGVIEGDVHTRGKVEIAASGSLTGDVTAPSICVRKGARMLGFCRIAPLPAPTAPPAPETDEQKTTSPAKPASKKAVPKSRRQTTAKPPQDAPGKVKAIRTTRRSKRTTTGT